MEELGPEAREAVERAAKRAGSAQDRVALEGVARSLDVLARRDREWSDLRVLAENVASLSDLQPVPPALIRMARRLATGTLAPRGE